MGDPVEFDHLRDTPALFELVSRLQAVAQLAEFLDTLGVAPAQREEILRLVETPPTAEPARMSPVEPCGSPGNPHMWMTLQKCMKCGAQK